MEGTRFNALFLQLIFKLFDLGIEIVCFKGVSGGFGLGFFGVFFLFVIIVRRERVLQSQEDGISDSRELSPCFFGLIDLYGIEFGERLRAQAVNILPTVEKYGSDRLMTVKGKQCIPTDFYGLR